ncbi:MAG TPA: CofH family radical SAM protein [Gemmatimonadaceae bacterium]|nr:CofH family radical SAM protein [Gemmatimonadaceae bacterium]
MRRIGEQLEAAQRLTTDDARAAYATHDLIGLGVLADAVNRAQNGDVVTFAANQHINPTNVCVLRTTCAFCGYARLPKEEGAYRYTLDQVLAEAATAATGLTKEFHIVGGLDMKAGLEYYAAMFRALKSRFPHVHIKALTAVEIAHIARIEKMSWRDVLIALRDAGLDTLPGGGAETFSAAVREQIAGKKLGGADYIGVHRTAHELGIRSNCTMLYGHVETIDDRVEHLRMLRDLQDETGGFLAFIPLSYHPDDNVLGERLGRRGTSSGGVDDLKMVAVARLFLDNFQHIKSHWIMVSPALTQVTLNFGVNDIEGTVVREKIYHAVGATTPQGMTLDQLLALIRGAGKVPAERDSFYKVLRTFESSTAATTSTSAATGASRQSLRVGRIPYVNCYPVYGAIDRGIVSLNAELHTGVPTALNTAMRAGDLDVSVVSAVEYARASERYVLLPDLAISCDGPVRSVTLFSTKPAESLNGERVVVARSSMTSVALLELLFAHVWKAKPAFDAGDAEPADIATLNAPAHLVIGDAALMLRAAMNAGQTRFTHAYDLGEVWRDWTGLPFVFAVWVAKRDIPVQPALGVHASLIASRNWGLANLDPLAQQAHTQTGVALAECREYLSGLDYGLSLPHLNGLTEFFRRLELAGQVPASTLAFLPAA